MPLKVFLDTDIGSDIDDAVCLAYLLANPACELLGITTVSGEGLRRARLADALCRVAGRRIPIFPGAERPLLIEQRQPDAPQAAALHRWEHQEEFPTGRAVEFLRDTVHSHPGEIVLLTIGPLTNAALLFATDPEIPRLLRGMATMGGVFTNRLAGVGPREWNILLDPHAAAMVYDRDVRAHRSIGLDVTCRVKMPAAEVRRRFQAELLKPVLDFAEIWFRERDEITFHDPLAAATIFDPDICRLQRGTVEVELGGEKTAGMTHWTPDPAGRHEAAMEVDADRFFAEFFSKFE